MVNPLFGVNAGRKLRSVSAPESAAAQEEVEGGGARGMPPPVGREAWGDSLIRGLEHFWLRG